MMTESPICITAGRSGWSSPVASNTCLKNSTRPTTTSTTIRGVRLCQPSGSLNPTEETHLHVGAKVLRERGWPERIVEAICSHGDYMKIPRDTPLKKAIYACDELVGFIGACVKVRPSKKLADLPPESVVKKLKDKAFARSVDRSYVTGGASAGARALFVHITSLPEAPQPIAAEIGL